MFDIAVLVALLVVSYRIASALRREKSIAEEFHVHKGVTPLVVLYPLGPIVLLASAFVVPFPIAHILAIACFVPGMLLARSQSRRLDSAGTDRVRGIQSALTEAFGAALLGLLYVLGSLAITYGARAVVVPS